jgi:hypothetical protein
MSLVLLALGGTIPSHAASDIMGRVTFLRFIQDQWWRVLAPVEHVDLAGKTPVSKMPGLHSSTSPDLSRIGICGRSCSR